MLSQSLQTPRRSSRKPNLSLSLPVVADDFRRVNASGPPLDKRASEAPPGARRLDNRHRDAALDTKPSLAAATSVHVTGDAAGGTTGRDATQLSSYAGGSPRLSAELAAPARSSAGQRRSRRARDDRIRATEGPCANSSSRGRAVAGDTCKPSDGPSVCSPEAIASPVSFCTAQEATAPLTAATGTDAMPVSSTQGSRLGLAVTSDSAALTSPTTPRLSPRPPPSSRPPPSPQLLRSPVSRASAGTPALDQRAATTLAARRALETPIPPLNVPSPTRVTPVKWQPPSPTAVRSPHAELIQQRAAEARARQAHMDEAWGALLLRDEQHGCSACGPSKGAAGECAADSLPLTAGGASKTSWGASWQLLMASGRSLKGWNGGSTAAKDSDINGGVPRGDELGRLSGGADESGGDDKPAGSIVRSKTLGHAAHTSQEAPVACAAQGDLHSLSCSPTLSARRAIGTSTEARTLSVSSSSLVADDDGGSIPASPIGVSTRHCSSLECSTIYSCAIPSPETSASTTQSVRVKRHPGTATRCLYRRGTPRKLSSCSNLPHLPAAAAPALHTPATTVAGAANAAATSCGGDPGTQLPVASADDSSPAAALPSASLPHRSFSSSMLSAPPLLPVSPNAETGEKGTRPSQMRKRVSFNSMFSHQARRGLVISMARSLHTPCLKPLAEPRHAPRMLRARLCQERVHSFPQIGSAISVRRSPVGHVTALRVTSNSASPRVSVADHRRSFSGSVSAPSLHRSPLGTFSVSSHAAASGNATTTSDVAADVSGVCKPEFAAELAAAVDVVERACHVCLAVREQMVLEEQGGYSSGSESEGGSSRVDKKDRSPVTVADFAVQALAALELARQFPGVPLLGEEDASLLRAHLAAPSAPTPSPPAAQADTVAAMGSATAAAAGGAASSVAAGAAGAAGTAGGGEQGPSLAERVTDLVLCFASPHALAVAGAGAGAEEGSGGRVAAVEAVLAAIDAAAAATYDLHAAARAAPRHRRYWVLDPIDGTRGFLRGRHNQYAVGLALIQDGELVLSALGLPNMPLPRGTSSPTQSTGDVAGSAGADEGDVENDSEDDMWQRPRGWPSLPLAKGLEAAAPHASHVTVLPLCCGSLCKYAAVALGYAAVFIQHPLSGSPHLKVWDHAAGVLCVTEAGGQVTDFAGQLLDLGGEAGQGDQEAAHAAAAHAPEEGGNDGSSGSDGSLAYFSPHGGGVVATNGVLHAQVLHHLATGLRMRRS
ncbi:unnamed protein product [Closterium sp. Yama58-4]|nr:unnamed protein product [Closterium sp. Yama58-4]